MVESITKKTMIKIAVVISNENVKGGCQNDNTNLNEIGLSIAQLNLMLQKQLDIYNKLVSVKE